MNRKVAVGLLESSSEDLTFAISLFGWINHRGMEVAILYAGCDPVRPTAEVFKYVFFSSPVGAILGCDSQQQIDSRE